LASAPKEGLRFVRLMMVLSSMTPLFVLWAIRGVDIIPDKYFILICLGFILLPNVILYWRWKSASKQQDIKTLTIGKADDHRDHLLVYLFAMLIPLYDANLQGCRDFAATVTAFLFIVFLFWHLNLHYMNLIFALFGYRVFTIEPPKINDGISGKHNFVLLTKRSSLAQNEEIKALRLSNTVFLEPEE
jgi:hypothetical protein